MSLKSQYKIPIILLLAMLLAFSTSAIPVLAVGLNLSHQGSVWVKDNVANEQIPLVVFGLGIGGDMEIRGTAGNVRRVYVGIDCSNFTNQIQKVTSANLSIFATFDTDDRHLSVLWTPNASWSETTITWDNQPCGTTLGTLSTGCNRTSIYNQSYTGIGSSGRTKIDVTEEANAKCRQGQNGLLHFIFWQSPETSSGELHFDSKDNANPNTRPLFQMAYDVVVPKITNSSWNVTSNDLFTNAISTNWRQGRKVNFSVSSFSNLDISFTVNVSQLSNMSCSLTEGNYTQMVSANASHKSATTNTKNHAYTLSDTINTEGGRCVYCSFKSASGTGETPSGVSHSGCMRINVNRKPISNGTVNPIAGQAFSGVKLINWNGFTDINMTKYKVFLNETLLAGNILHPTTQYNFNFSSVSNGFYNITILGNDSFGNFSTITIQNFEVVSFVAQGVSPNVTLLVPNGSTYTGIFPIYVNFTYNLGGVGSLNATGNCSVLVNGTPIGSVVAVVGNQSLNDIAYSQNDSFVWNVSCDSGYQNLNSPRSFSIAGNPVVLQNDTSLFQFGSCPSTTPEVLLYGFFTFLFIMMTAVGFVMIPIIGILGGLGLLIIAVTLISCIGFLLATLMVLASLVLIISIGIKGMSG